MVCKARKVSRRLLSTRILKEVLLHFNFLQLPLLFPAQNKLLYFQFFVASSWISSQDADVHKVYLFYLHL
jgi:hypothetical protein